MINTNLTSEQINRLLVNLDWFIPILFPILAYLLWYMNVGSEILSIIMVVSILLYIMWHVSNLETGSVLDKFTGKFSVIGSIFIPVGIILTYRVFSLQYKTMQRDATYKIIDRGWFTINDKFVDFYDKASNFIDSLFYDWQKEAYSNGKYSESNKKKDDWYAVSNISNRIFQTWEDFLTSSDIDQTDEIAWIVPFIQWCSSPLLYKSWQVTRLHYSELNRQLGDYLFDVSLKSKPKTEQDLFDIAKKFNNSEKYKEIIRKRQNGN